MLPQPSAKNKPKASRIKYVGIVADADALGVSRTHLWRVLQGERKSPLLTRYWKLKRSQNPNGFTNQAAA